MNKTALAIHGGAGTILKSLMTAEIEAEYQTGLRTALEIGWSILQKGGAALEAVERTVCELENFPLFNAGRGSVFTHEGKNEMDAAIMDGARLKAGAVGFVKNVKNPVRLARLVMEKTEHILLAGDGANRFARQMNVDFADDAYFYTDLRYQQLLKAREENVIQLDHTAEEPEILTSDGQSQTVAQIFNPQSGEEIIKSKSENTNPKPIGTVGAVACDSEGNLAAATSTGGMTNKKFGRVGDTPIIGAGTYADNATCAVSCTGHGEYFMLAQTAFDVAARMKYKNLNLTDAAGEAIARLGAIGGEGGLIAVDTGGNLALPFNSEGMYRGFVSSDEEFAIQIYAD
ncbi:MAG TPA: isoaspartyl peptidase/L-asparaginase [Pyrinomonadaceae bacterium]|jgi:beta-aspartyl-peptidase (threonine type)